MEIKSENYLLGMDCGTTNMKAILLRGDGKIVATASRRSTTYSPGTDMQEQDACEWWDNAVEIFRELNIKAGPEIIHRVQGIAISSHTVTLLPLDHEGWPLRKALTCQDNRSSAELESILQQMGLERFVQIVGGQPSPAFLPNKILWFKNREPELFARTDCLLQASSYINFRLTGEKTTDIDQAVRTQCLDVNTMEWSEEIGKILGVDLNKLLPKPVPVDEIIGTVTEKAAKETGLVAGIPVLAGCSDALASMYATGMSRLGEAGESSGTTSLIFVGSDIQSAPDIPGATKPSPTQGMPWIADPPHQASGASIKWFIETMAAEEQEYAKANDKNVYTYLNEMALEAEPGCRGLFYFPYLLGEKAPLWNSYAKGMLIGLGMDTTRNELVRSVFEGTAYAIRHVMETVKESGAKANVLRICGGGAKSRTWSMIKASMLHMPVLVLDENSGDVPVGDALIAGHKVGIFPDLTEAVNEIVKVKEVIEPNPEWEEAYDRYYPYYVEMYRHLDEDLKKLKSTVAELAANKKIGSRIV
ncbi:MAG: carbohydrate kinase [Clostridiales bacterium]|nr:carbohydrate kinase [Clostridiales bacterium]